MSPKSFADRLFAAVQAKGSVVVVGIDPDPRFIPRSYFPKHFSRESIRKGLADGVRAFASDVLEAVADIAVAIKPQLAYFERLGPAGMAVYEDVVRQARG